MYNLVQLAALICKTNVGQARATARAMMHSYLIRYYNADLVAKKVREDNVYTKPGQSRMDK